MATAAALPVGRRRRPAVELRRSRAVGAPARRVWALAASRRPRELEPRRAALRQVSPVRWARPEREPIDWRQASARPWIRLAARTTLAFGPAQQRARRPRAAGQKAILA